MRNEYALRLSQVPVWVTDQAGPQIARILAILLGAVLLRWVLIRAVHRLVQRTVRAQLSGKLDNRATRALVEATGAASDRRSQRMQTLGSVLRSIITGIVFGIALLMVLSEFSIDLAPIIASAGVVGVALGFGAQNLVRDFLSGTFIVLEDQYGVGDVVNLGEVTGTVEAVSLRITQLRDGNGMVWYVRNGEILRVANQSQGWATAVVELPVVPSTDLPAIRAALEPMLAALHPGLDSPTGPTEPELLETPQILGVEPTASGGMALRITAKTSPTSRAATQRILLERSLRALAEAGVKLPNPDQGSGGAPKTSG